VFSSACPSRARRLRVISPVLHSNHPRIARLVTTYSGQRAYDRADAQAGCNTVTERGRPPPSPLNLRPCGGSMSTTTAAADAQTQIAEDVEVDGEPVRSHRRTRRVLRVCP